MSEPAVTRSRMSVAEFLRWHEDQPETERYELEQGQPVLMAPERWEHSQAKLRIARALADAAAAAGLDCDAFIDGPMVQVADDRSYQPDAGLRCGPPLPPDTFLVPDPLVLVEVVSPSSERQDRLNTFEGHFRVDSLRHYIIVHLGLRRVIHHRCPAPGAIIETRILAESPVVLDPPGLTLSVATLLG
jgi:Uma2 family endonuclease